MTEQEALIRAVVDDPADDTVRLVYADWLDEHDAVDTEACPACVGHGGHIKPAFTFHATPANAMSRDDFYATKKDRTYRADWGMCPACRATPGVQEVPNWYARRAELIRTGIAVEGISCGCRAETGEEGEAFCGPHQRHVELLFAAMIPCPVGGVVLCAGLRWFAPLTNPRSVWRRGFVEKVFCSTHALFGRRGSVRHLFSNHPVTAVHATDKAPRPIHLSGGYRPPSWHCTENLGGASFLPPVLYEAVREQNLHHAEGPGTVMSYETEEEAYAAVSQACVALGRAQAGLTERTFTT